MADEEDEAAAAAAEDEVEQEKGNDDDEEGADVEAAELGKAPGRRARASAAIAQAPSTAWRPSRT